MAESAHTSETPSLLDVNNGAAITVGATIVFAADGQVTAIRFWAPGTNTGTYTGALYEVTSDDDPAGSGTGDLLVSAAVASGNITAGAFNDITVASVDVTAGTYYRAAVHCTSGRIVATGAAFASAAITNGNVTDIQHGTATPLGTLHNGAFTEGVSLSYPATSFNATDYFVDVVFSEGPPPDVAVGAGVPITAATAVGYQGANSGIGSATTSGGYL